LSAANALGQIGDVRAVRPLIAALGDENMRYFASIALRQIGTLEAIEALKTAGYSVDRYVSSPVRQLRKTG